MKFLRSLSCLAALLAANGLPSAHAADVATALSAAPRPHRLLVLSDIEADPDDTQSFVRLLLYSNEIELEGLVATTSVWKRASVAPDSIRAVIRAYAKVQSNLLQHDARYPNPDLLQSLVKQGRPEYGMLGVGAGKDSEGSDWIIRVLQKPDDRPLWVAVWGGVNTLAQALHTLQATRPSAEVASLVAKLRVYTISDQDDAGPWIRKTFPGVFYIVTPGGDYGAATWTGINSVVTGIDNTTISNRWLAQHIQQGHGPLGAVYPDVAWGVEGDTPSWLALIPNGLNEPDHPNWGGWGGRYALYLPQVPTTDPKTFVADAPIAAETRPIWTNAEDDYAPPLLPEFGRATKSGEKSFHDAKVTLWRWRDDLQNDFAARMAWTTKPYAEANHPPVPVLDHPATITVHGGQGFGLSAQHSTDPDGDSLSFLWFNYPEAGSLKQPVKLDGAENATGAWIIAPKVTKPETLHFILRVTDKGTPALSRYQRVIVTVLP